LTFVAAHDADRAAAGAFVKQGDGACASAAVDCDALNIVAEAGRGFDARRCFRFAGREGERRAGDEAATFAKGLDVTG
jgi:hypothetical protein